MQCNSLGAGGTTGTSQVDRWVAVGPTGQRLRAAVFNDRSFAHFAAPHAVRCLPGSMCPSTLLFVQRDFLKAGLDAAVIALLEADGSKHFHQTVDAVRPCCTPGPVLGLMEAPPIAGIASRECNAVVPNRGGINEFEPFGG